MGRRKIEIQPITVRTYLCLSRQPAVRDPALDRDVPLF